MDLDLHTILFCMGLIPFALVIWYVWALHFGPLNPDN